MYNSPYSHDFKKKVGYGMNLKNLPIWTGNDMGIWRKYYVHFLKKH